MAEGTARVALVTPSYNQAAFLEEAIESVLAQGYPGLQYAVVDAGSTDGSVGIIRRYEDRLAWWSSGRDAGQAAALNAAFARCDADVLGWLNSDDMLLPGALETAAAALVGDEEAVLVYGDNVLVDERSRRLASLQGRPLDVAAAVRTWQNPVPQPGALFRRRALELAGPLDETLHYYFDFAWLLRLALAGARVVHLPRELAAYRLHPGSKSMSAAEVKAREHLRLSASVLGRADLPPAVAAVAREAEARSHLTAAKYFHAVLDLPAARREARRALRLAPPALRRDAAAMVARSALPRSVVRTLRAARARASRARSVPT